MIIQAIDSDHKAEAMHLVLSVFMEFEAPEYSNEGIQSFQEYITNHEAITRLSMYGAYEQDKLIGVIATRKGGNHISLFFVDKAYHRQGIGRKLFQTAARHNTTGTMTVNASPYAVPIYKHLGFVSTDTEQVTDGIRYTPMIYRIQRYSAF